MLTAGFALLLLDGWEQGIAFSVQSLQFRSIEEPSGRAASGAAGKALPTCCGST